MTEIFDNISDETKEIARLAWTVAMAQNNPATAANFLNSVTEYYRNILTEVEVEFLQFYFNMRMEMIKQ
jgi:hypothetical protein